jgi:hypothetical protein
LRAASILKREFNATPRKRYLQWINFYRDTRIATSLISIKKLSFPVSGMSVTPDFSPIWVPEKVS